MPVLPGADFEERFAAAAEAASFDLVFLSEVMFNRGYLVKGLAALCRRLKATGAEVVVASLGGVMAAHALLETARDALFLARLPWRAWRRVSTTACAGIEIFPPLPATLCAC